MATQNTYTASWLECSDDRVYLHEVTYQKFEVAKAVARAAEKAGRKMVRLFDDLSGVDLLAANESWDELAPE